MFRIQISGNTQKYMDVMGIDSYPFTTKELQTLYRNLTKKHHPDICRDKNATEKMAEINKAYAYLKALATVDEYSAIKSNSLLKEDPDESIFSRKLYETCNECGGSGKLEYAGFSEKCDKCCNIYNAMRGGRPGVVALLCKACDHGEFTLKSGRKVPCRKCNGTGYFKVTCNKCHGQPFYNHDSYKRDCPKCGGTGKVKMDLFNPVIPEGAVL
jgi:hypothetical protein